MTQKQLNKLIKKEKKRKFARGVGAAAGTLSSLLVLGLMFGKDIKNAIKK